MEIILLEKVENLGNLGDRVRVKSGYARNYLVPKGIATEATTANIARFEARRAELEMAAADAMTAAQARKNALEQLQLTIAAKAGNEGRLFGSVGPADIADAAAAAGVEIKRGQVRLDELLRQVGEYEVGVHLHTDVDAVIKVSVVPLSQ